MKNTKIMDIVCDILEDQQQNSIDCYEYDGIDLTLTEPIRMQSTILLTLFRPLACPPKVVPSVKLVVVEKERNRVYDT